MRRFRTELRAAMTARQPETVSALRAAIDNAEAQRRTLSLDEVGALLRAQVDERVTAAEHWEAHGRADAAARLRREADALRDHLLR